MSRSVKLIADSLKLVLYIKLGGNESLFVTELNGASTYLLKGFALSLKFETRLLFTNTGGINGIF